MVKIFIACYYCPKNIRHPHIEEKESKSNTFVCTSCTDWMGVYKTKEILVLQKDCEYKKGDHCKGCHIRHCWGD